MLLKKYLPAFAAAMALSLSVVACNDEEPAQNEEKPVVKPDDPDQPGGNDVLDPVQSKRFLEQTAEEYLNLFRAADQRALISLCNYFDREYGYLEAPDEFEIEGYDDADTYRLVRGMLRGMAYGDASRAASSVFSWSCSIDFEQFAGIYEPGNRKWVKVKDSDDIVFKFRNEAGGDCELRATALRNVSDVSFTIVYAGEKYNPATGRWEELQYEDNYNIRLPKELTVTLTSGGTVMSDAKLVSTIDLDRHSLSVDADMTAANLRGVVKIKGSDSKVTAESGLYISNSLTTTAEITVNGSHLCDYDYLSGLGDSSDDILKVFHSGEVKTSVLGKVQIDGSISFDRDVIGAMNGYWDDDEYDTPAQAEADVKKAVDALNRNFKTEVRYNKGKAVQATLAFQHKYNEWYYYWEYEIEPMIYFAADKTSYSFEQYFGSGFSGVETLFADIVNNYKKVWESFDRR